MDRFTYSRGGKTRMKRFLILILGALFLIAVMVFFEDLCDYLGIPRPDPLVW